MATSKKYIENDLKIKNTEEDPIYFSEYDAEGLSKIIENQRKVTEYQKKKIIRNYFKF